MTRYKIELTETQLRVINAALEEFFRIPLNQWDRLAERLAFKGVDLKDEKTRERNIDRCIAAKDAAQEVFKAAGRILWQHGTLQKDDEQLIAEDIWQVIRHQLYLDSGSTDTWRVDSREAIQWGPEPLPCIERISVDKSTDSPTIKSDMSKVSGDNPTDTCLREINDLLLDLNSVEIKAQIQMGSLDQWLKRWKTLLESQVYGLLIQK